jgi:hypothetical protein
MYSNIIFNSNSSILVFAVFAGISKAFENITAQEDGIGTLKVEIYEWH